MNIIKYTLALLSITLPALGQSPTPAATPLAFSLPSPAATPLNVIQGKSLVVSGTVASTMIADFSALVADPKNLPSGYGLVNLKIGIIYDQTGNFKALRLTPGYFLKLRPFHAQFPAARVLPTKALPATTGTVQ